MVKKTPKPILMVAYYVKLTKIFWISGSHLYHGYAWLKLILDPVIVVEYPPCFSV